MARVGRCSMSDYAALIRPTEFPSAQRPPSPVGRLSRRRKPTSWPELGDAPCRITLRQSDLRSSHRRSPVGRLGRRRKPTSWPELGDAPCRITLRQSDLRSSHRRSPVGRLGRRRKPTSWPELGDAPCRITLRQSDLRSSHRRRGRQVLQRLVSPSIPALTDHGWGLAEASGKPPAIASMACSSTLQPISRSSGVALSISL